MRIANFTERPVDEYYNRSYTGSAPVVIKAKVEPGRGSAATLHILEPKAIKDLWPTVSALYWQEVNHPAGAITEEKWKSLWASNPKEYTIA